MGTVSYMSPEQVKGLAVDHRSDVLRSAPFCTRCSGERLQARHAPETLTAICARSRPSSRAPIRIDPALDGLVRHCLEKSPEERFQSARDRRTRSTLSSSSGNVSGATGRVSAVEQPLLAAVRSSEVRGGLLLGALAAGVFLKPKAVEPPIFRC
jgi:serine/threonine protein kinase